MPESTTDLPDDLDTSRLRVVSVPLDDIQPHPRNARRGDVAAIASSLLVHGQYRPVVVQKSTGHVLAGNHTWKAARRLRDNGASGWDRIDAVVLDVDDVEAVRIMLVDNRSAELGDGYDDTVLAELLRELPDLEGTGWEPADLDALLEEIGADLDPGDPGEDGDAGDAGEEVARPTLADRFVVPPFSVLDARGGAWRARKQHWMSYGIQSELGRSGELIFRAPPELIEERTHDVSEGSPLWHESRAALKVAVEAAGWTRKRVDEHLGTNGMAGHYFGESQPATPTPEQWRRLAEVLPLPEHLWMPMTETRQRPPSEGALVVADAVRTPGGRSRGLVISDAAAAVPTYYAQKNAAEERLGRDLSHEEFTRDHLDTTGAGEGLSNGGTSIFDPVLVELAVRWFSPPGGHVLDPFAGGSVRGIVTTLLGRSYEGIELRGEQVDANETQRHIAPPDADLTWTQGDSNQVLDQPGRAADLVFSCPPYAYLEKYSDDPADLSTMTADGFKRMHAEIIRKAVARLAPNRYAVWVIGDVRAKNGDGRYLGLIRDTIDAFEAAGCGFYNEMILLTPTGSMAVRVGRQFTLARKAGRIHQHVLVFVKGDGRQAARDCGPVEVEVPEPAADAPDDVETTNAPEVLVSG